jgi:hypothetical protein
VERGGKERSAVETTTAITASVLRKRMRERDISQTALARASGMQQSEVSGILGGWIRVGPKREARLAAGIVRLGLDKDALPEEKLDTAPPVVIRIDIV